MKELRNLNKLTNDSIIEIVSKVPNELMTKKHKEFIISYLMTRKDILLRIK